MIARYMGKDSYRIAILGATGLVGRAIITTLEKRQFPIDDLKLLATPKSEGRTITYKGEELKVEAASKDAFRDVDVALFSAGANTSRNYAEAAVEKGSVVIDNSSAYRMNGDVPLVVPEVNPKRALENTGIIANPNCSTIQLVVALNPLMKLGVEHVFVSTYQSVSGMGQKGVDRLMNEVSTRDRISPDTLQNPENIPYAFNAVPKCDVFLDNGYTKEEMKVFDESRKILEAPDLKMTVTAVRVPVLYGHAESVTVKFRDRTEASTVRKILSEAPGVTVADNPNQGVFPHPLMAEGSGQTFVGRIREDLNDPTMVNMFVVADNILKGAAWNAVQIAEVVSSSQKETAN